MPCKVHRALFSPTPSFSASLKSSNASTLLNSLIVWWMATSFQRLTANPQRTLCPSCSLRLLAAPCSVGPTVFPWARPPTGNILLVPPGVCGSWPLLAGVGARFFSGITANLQRTYGSSCSVRLLAAPCSVGPATAPTQSKMHPQDARCCAPPGLLFVRLCLSDAHILMWVDQQARRKKWPSLCRPRHTWRMPLKQHD